MKKATLLLVLVLVILLAGCARQQAHGSATASAGAEGTVQPADSKDSQGFVSYPATDYAAQAPGHPGGTLHLSTSTETTVLDPHGASATYVQWFGRLVFDNLVYLDAAGVAQPWLAKSWTISPDGKTYTFHLRDDVTFSDGARFDAEAVRVNLEHMRDPATKSPLAGRYIAPYAEGRVIDEFTFEARLKQPYTPFLDVLAQSWLAMLSPKQIRENPKSATTAPIGSGPFVLESYKPQQGLRFVRRADYHWSPPYLHHDGPAYLDRIEIDFIPEALIRYSGLAAGQYDLTFELPTANAASVRADPALMLDKRIRKGIPARGLTFNTGKAPFDDVRVRRAVAFAVDRDGIVQLVGFGEYQPKADFLAANTQYYDPAFRNVLHFDPAAANHLFDEAGWTGRDAAGYRTKEGLRLGADFLLTETATPSPVAVAIQSDLKKVGFELRLIELPATQLTDHRNSGDYQAIAGGVWHTNTPDALYILHHSDEITTPDRIGQNTSRLRDPEFDDLVSRARQASDPVVLQDLYSQAQRRLIDLVPAIPLYENYTFIAYRKRVHGLLFDTSHNTPVFTAAWLDADQR
jgi:peptide/nickel transport system substrate-binding protein